MTFKVKFNSKIEIYQILSLSMQELTTFANTDF